MTPPKKGLGRGISSILSQTDQARTGLTTLSISQLIPNAQQPRQRFEDTKLQELADSIKELGILQPILVRADSKRADRYEIIAGERRFRAAGMAGLTEVPVVIRSTIDDRLLMEALAENIHRADLDPIEEALAYQQLIEDFGFSHEVLATKLAKSRTVITNSLRLLSLVEEVQDLLSTGAMRAGHARALVPLGAKDQREVATIVVAEQLSVRQTEELAKKRLEGPVHVTRVKQAPSTRPEFAHAVQALSRGLGTDVAIKGTPRRGRIEVSFAGLDDLERLLEAMGMVEDDL